MAENKNSSSNDASQYYHDKGMAHAKYGGNGPEGLFDHPNDNERAAYQRGYENQKLADEIKKGKDD
jgi:hypothetical protein